MVYTKTRQMDVENDLNKWINDSIIKSTKGTKNYTNKIDNKNSTKNIDSPPLLK